MPTESELTAWYDAHADAVFGFLLTLTRSEADSRDLLQESFLRLARNPEPFRHVRAPRAFLLTLARNLALDLFRRRRTRSVAEADWESQPPRWWVPDPDPDLRLKQDAVQAGLAGLPDDQRAVVHLKVWENLTFADIAEMLELSPNTVASRYRYGLEKLRQALMGRAEEIRP